MRDLISLILAALTPEQRDALRWLPADGSYSVRLPPLEVDLLRFWKITPCVTVRLTEYISNRGTRLTDLGRQVREAIERDG